MDRATLLLTSLICNLSQFVVSKPQSCISACERLKEQIVTAGTQSTAGHFPVLSSSSSVCCFPWNAAGFGLGGKTGWATRWRLQPRLVTNCHLSKHDLEENQTVYTCLTLFCTDARASCDSRGWYSALPLFSTDDHLWYPPNGKHSITHRRVCTYFERLGDKQWMFAGMGQSGCRSEWFQVARKRSVVPLLQLALQMRGTGRTDSLAVRHQSLPGRE